MRLTLAALLLAVILPAAFGADEKRLVSSVFVKGTELYVTEAGAKEPRQLTADGLPKRLPVLSKDGSRIAFISEPHERALANLVIMSPDGTRLRQISFRPEEAHISGMRFVERLEWMSNQRLAVSGSVNPSTGEYVVVDVETGREVAWYAVDGFNWSVSPDGSHVAFVGNVVHFTPEQDRRPQFCVDDECPPGKPPKGYPGDDTHLEFTTAPLWSPGGTAVAITAEDYETKTTLVVVKPLHSKPLRYTPPGAEDSLRISWDGAALVVRTGLGAWRLEPGSSIFVPSK